jgi:GntR family transcriptional regulator/MocR family aminotransferase
MSFVLLKHGSNQPLYRQLYEALREAILRGRLEAGVRLPSSRAIAEQLNIGRNTVLDALDQLAAEGYVLGKRGSGTCVTQALPELEAPPRHLTQTEAFKKPRLSRRGATIARAPNPFIIPAGPKGPAFRLGPPALDHFPAEVWGRLLHRRFQRSSAALIRHRDPFGYLPLRRSIAAYLNDARGVRCAPEQILIVTGSQQALGLIAQLVLDPGDEVWVEDPGYTGSRGAIVAAGGIPIGVPLDADGLDVAAGRRKAPKARLAVVTPSSQFPLVITMGLQRRVELLSWAGRSNSWIVEDDYDSELRYAGRPLAALQGLDTQDRVFYVGTFSKVLSPALRLGYLVVPSRLLNAFATAKSLADVRTPSLEQAVLSDFIEEGHFARHLRRMRVLYAERQSALLEAARRHLPPRLALGPAPSGMHLVAWLGEDDDDRAVARAALGAGLWVQPLSAFRMRAGPGALLLGYAAVDARSMREGVQTLARVLSD